MNSYTQFSTRSAIGVDLLKYYSLLVVGDVSNLLREAEHFIFAIWWHEKRG